MLLLRRAPFWHSVHTGTSRRAQGDLEPNQYMKIPANEGRVIRAPNLLIWSQTRCRCAIPPLGILSK